MKKDGKAKLIQAGVCVLCAVIVWIQGSGIERTEFSGGWLTGPLLEMTEVGSVVFILALLLTLFYRRFAAATALTACLLCLPCYLYLLAPGPFRWVFRGKYSVPLQANFVLNDWDTAGIVALTISACLSIWVASRSAASGLKV